MRAFSVDAAGNRFVLIDCVGGETPADPASLAQQICEEPNGEGFHADGVLLCVQGTGEAAVGMVLYNRDGTRPEACGNGLRAIALFAEREGYAGERFVVMTDAGPRRVRVNGGAVEVCLGPVKIEDQERVVKTPNSCVSGVRVTVGNPHFVLFTDLAATASIEECGHALATHPSFPMGTNVAFVGPVETGEPLDVRIHERGVGETGACGTGAAAVAFVAVARGLAEWPVAIRLRGGDLLLDQRADGVWLSGPTKIMGPWKTSH